MIGFLLGAALTAAFASAASAAADGRGASGAPEAPQQPELVVEIPASGPPLITGRVPAGISRSALKTAFPSAQFDPSLVSGVGGDAEDWTLALEALPVTLPRIARARIEICAGVIRIEGQLKPGFALGSAQSALRAALGPNWELEMTLEEAPLPAELSFAISSGRLTATGILPDGLSVRQGAATLSETAAGSEIQFATGGYGDTAEWTVILGTLGRLGRLYDAAEGTVGGGVLEIGGQLAPGQQLAEIEHWLVATLPDGWEIAATGKEMPADRDARRIGPETGAPERLRDGHWVPELPPEADVDACQRSTMAAQRARRLEFLSGESVLAPESERVLDRIAGISLSCLSGGGPSRHLDIGGHTDAQGPDQRNLALSEARAQAVLGALAARGVPRGALRATGFGEALPIAPNDTIEGRQRNRRITFEWIDD
ncbi:MAG: OmpA family protein [Pseudomonadota bacterium]